MSTDNSVGVFISHHTASSSDLVWEISSCLETLNINHWFAQRDIGPTKDYKEEITRAIKNCDLFLFLLNENSNLSKPVKKELSLADSMDHDGSRILCVRLDDCEPCDAVTYAISDNQMLDLRNQNRVVAAQNIARAIQDWYDGKPYRTTAADIFSSKGKENSLEFYGDEGERERLRLQREFVFEFAQEEYDNLISDMENAVFLDVGCNTGEQAMMFLEGRKEISRYVGIDREEAALCRGRELFPEGRFYNVNCVTDDLDKRLTEIEKELNIDGFDIINISMLLLHIKEPQGVVDDLRSHLNEGGKIIVLDIDDGLSFAYPDSKGHFEKAVEICSNTAYSGWRTRGRQIPQLLYEADFENVKLHKQGLCTVGMGREKRGDFFELYFWFILDDLRKMHAENPNNELITNRWQWMEDNYKDMKKHFQKKDFYFNLGFMLFSAM